LVLLLLLLLLAWPSPVALSRQHISKTLCHPFPLPPSDLPQSVSVSSPLYCRFGGDRAVHGSFARLGYVVLVAVNRRVLIDLYFVRLQFARTQNLKQFEAC